MNTPEVVPMHPSVEIMPNHICVCSIGYLLLSGFYPTASQGPDDLNRTSTRHVVLSPNQNSI